MVSLGDRFFFGIGDVSIIFRIIEGRVIFLKKERRKNYRVGKSNSYFLKNKRNDFVLFVLNFSIYLIL